MSVIPNLSYRFNAISTKISVSYFVDIYTLILKLRWKGKRPKIAKTILKKNKVRGLTQSNFKIIIKLQISRLLGCGERMATLINGTEQRAEELTHTDIVN